MKHKTLNIIYRGSVGFVALLWVFSAAVQIGPFPSTPQNAEAAFSSITARGSAVRGSGNNANVSVSPSSNITAGKIAIVTVVTDSEQTTDGDSTLHTVTDTDGNTWTKVFERTETDGADSDGASASIWWSHVATQIDTSDSITATFGANQSDAIIAVFEVTVGAGKTVATTTTTPTHGTSGTNASISHTLSGLTSREYMFVGFLGAEGEDTTKTAIANYVERFDLISTGSGAADANVQMHVGTRILTGTGDTWTTSALDHTSVVQSLVAFYETDITTTLADGTDPGNSTVAPGSAVTDLDAFTFQTSVGSDTITAVTVTLAPAGAFNNIAKVEVTDNSNVDECTDIDNPASLTLNFTGCSLVVGTSATTFKVRVTPKTHANMAAPASGVSYAVTGTVTDWTGSNTAHAGTDTDSATITIDNDSPNNASSASVSAGDEENSLSWTNPGDSDFDNVIVLQRTSSAVADTPTEGSTYATSTTIGDSTVVCSGLVISCVSTGLTNGTVYHYKIFAKDSNGNWSDTGTTPTGSPATPAGPTFTQATYRLYTPSDGSSWTARSALDNNDTWLDVTYGNNIFVAVSRSGDSIMTSPDGTTWTVRTAPNASLWQSVTYGNGLFVAVACPGTGPSCLNSTGTLVMTSPDGISWTSRSATGDDDMWESVTYGNGLFVAVGQDLGEPVMTSPDGINWTGRSAAGNNESWYGVTYGDGLFVAVGSTGGGDQVMTSPDGITWTARSAVGEDDFWEDVTYANGLFVAVGGFSSSDRIMTSPDGITWTARSAAGDDDSWDSVIFGNGIFVAVGSSGDDRVMTSPDGITWTAQSAAGNNDSWTGIAYGGGLFVGVSSSGDRVMTSGEIGGTVLANQDTAGTLTSTGQAFRLRTRIAVDDASSSINRRKLKLQYAQKSGSCDASFTGETYADVSESTPMAFFDDVGENSTTTPASGNEVTNAGRDLVYQTYEEANNFTNSVAAIPSGDDGLWDFSLYDNGMSGSYCLRVVKSTDAQTWMARSAAGNDDGWYGVTYGNGLFVAVGLSGGDRVMTSPDGITWTSRTAAGDDDFWKGVTYGNGLFVAVGYSGDFVMTSPDGITWTARTAAGDNDTWQDVTYGNGLFVAVGINGDRVMTSPDGITWTARTAAGDDDTWQDVTYGNSLFVAVGDSGDFVMTSPDGITWTAQTAAGDNDSWNEVTYGNGLFVAVGTNGDRVITSPDGITWTARTAAGDDDVWYGVTYGNGLFVAVGTGLSGGADKVMTSPDGITWTARTAAGDNDSWRQVAYGNGLFVVVGDSGDRVMTAPTGETVLDTYTVVPEIAPAAGAPVVHQLHYRWRKDNVSESSTSFTEVEDTQLNTSSVQIGDRVRLRVLLSNSGQADATDYAYRLNYSSGACSAWSEVPSSGDAEAWVMTTSARVSNGDATTNNTGLTDPDGLAFSAGAVVAGTNQAATSTLSASNFTEYEYVLRSTINASTGTTYCFRVSNGDSTTNFTYDVTPSLVLPANAERPQSGGSSSAVEAPAPPSAPVTGGDESGSEGGTGEGGGGGAPEGGGNEGGGGGGDLGTITRNLASILDNIKNLLLKLK